MQTLNIWSMSEDWRARKMSNFSTHSFTLDGQKFSSVEGFIVGIMFPYGDIMRQQAFESIGASAKKFSRHAARKFVWWNGEIIFFGSLKHREFIECAIRAKFEQNEDAMDALLATEDLVLTHDTGWPEPSNTSLPSAVFCDILTRIREEAIRARK